MHRSEIVSANYFYSFFFFLTRNTYFHYVGKIILVQHTRKLPECIECISFEKMELGQYSSNTVLMLLNNIYLPTSCKNSPGSILFRQYVKLFRQLVLKWPLWH